MPTIDPQEVAKFSAIADEWWDEEGKFKPLHRFNPTRIALVRDYVQAHFDCQSLEGLTLIDIGCGGGLLAEPFSRLGAAVTAIDASETNINVASLHAQKAGVNIDYRCSTAEQEAEGGQQYDVVLAMEIIEHVADIPLFLQSCAQLVKPGGLLFVATLNRTAKSWLFGIVGAEYVMRWLPRGTHDWRKFMKPSEIECQLRAANLQTTHIQGMEYNMLKDSWSLSEELSVNYTLVAQKQGKA